MPETDVVIVGGGPNGLLMAGELALAGVRPILLERLSEPDTSPKANGLVGRVVQALDYRGVLPLFTGTDTPPRTAPGFEFGALPLDLSTLDGHSLYALPIPQRRMEELLEERALKAGAEIRRGHECTAVTQGDHVTLDVHGPDGPYQLTTRFVVAADGGRSTIRKQCGIGFDGISDTGFVGRMGQVRIPPPVGDPTTGVLTVRGRGTLRPATFTRTDTGMFAFGMFQPGVYRLGIFEWGTEELEEGDITLDEIQAAASRVLGDEVPMTDLVGGRRTTGSNSRQATRYRHDRVFLAGDAAHVHSGIGGPGLNLGMQDVLNLAWKLAATVHGHAPDDLLDTYESERHPVGERVIMSTRAQTALISPGPNVTALRTLFTELLDDPANRRRVADLMAGADVPNWMPDLPLEGTRVGEVLRTPRPVLLDLANRADLRAVTPDHVDIVTTTTPEPPADAVLIRPDGYIAWQGDDADGLREALATWFTR